jgi:hypothetical protein
MGVKVIVTYDDCAPINDLWSWVVEYAKACGGTPDQHPQIFTKFSESLNRHLQIAFDEGRKFEEHDT